MFDKAGSIGTPEGVFRPAIEVEYKTMHTHVAYNREALSANLT
jgi:hypothetical protein